MGSHIQLSHNSAALYSVSFLQVQCNNVSFGSATMLQTCLFFFFFTPLEQTLGNLPAVLGVCCSMLCCTYFSSANAQILAPSLENKSDTGNSDLHVEPKKASELLGQCGHFQFITSNQETWVKHEYQWVMLEHYLSLLQYNDSPNSLQETWFFLLMVIFISG